jgi:hypothetical protein
VVSVRVSEQYCVNLIDAVGQGLLAKIRGSIYKDIPAFIPDQD